MLTSQLDSSILDKVVIMKEDIFENLKFNLRKTNIYIQKKINEELNKYDISSVHVLYIILLSEQDGLMPMEISSLIDVDKANTTRVLTDLLEKKLIYKTDDIRKYKVYLTDKGKEIALIISNKHEELKKLALKNISSEEIKIFQTVFLKILNNLKEEEKC